MNCLITGQLLCVSAGTVMSVRLTTCMPSMWKTPCSHSTSRTSPRTSASPGQSVSFLNFSFSFFQFSKSNNSICVVLLRQDENPDHTSDQIKSLLCTPIRNGKKDKVIGGILLSWMLRARKWNVGLATLEWSHQYAIHFSDYHQSN